MSEVASPKVGCCGFRLTKPLYAEKFPVVEVQQTFYEPPMVGTLKRWRAQVPTGFEFTLKAWQLITHPATSPTYRRLKTMIRPEEREECGAFQASPVVEQAWQTVQACAEALQARRVLFQCPASFKPTVQNIDNLRRFFTTMKRKDLQLLWEPRGEWPESVVEPLCAELNLAHVVDPFLARSVTPEFVYYRLHGGRDFQHVYSDAELKTVAELSARGKSAYVMFNNINMLEDAGRFQRMVEGREKVQELDLEVKGVGTKGLVEGLVEARR